MKPTSTCPCGRIHTSPTKNVAIGRGALLRLAEICTPYKHILVVYDRPVYDTCAVRVLHLLGKMCRASHGFDADELLTPDEAAIAAIEKPIHDRSGTPDAIDHIVGIGSGVINDLCKHVAHTHGLRYTIVATAPSMDGYASSGAALILGGMKVTLPATPPEAIVADTDVLCTAPMEMIRAGYGDIIGKYSCLNDWKLAALVRGEYLCPAVWQWVKDTADRVRSLADGIRRRDPAAIEALMQALVDVGVAMAYVGNSRPASGSEHHIAHYLEITGILQSRPYLAHGVDVACASVLTAALREKMLATSPTRHRFDREAYTAAMQTVYGPIANSVVALQDRMGWYTDPADEDFVLSHPDEVRAVLAEAPSAEETRSMVEAVGLSLADFQDFYGTDTLREAIRWGKDLKDRYTVLWPYHTLFAPSAFPTVPTTDFPARVHSGYLAEGHVQGIAIDREAGVIYYSFTTLLLKTDLAGHPIGSVRGIVGHLGCIDFDPVRRRVYGSLELKHDAIGAGIVARTGQALAEEDAFYLVAFDADRITRPDMDAEADGIMRAVYLPDVVDDYAATDEISGRPHRYGCSGIDGTAVGPAFGDPADAPSKILIAYGIYRDTEREDNDHQVILQFDPSVIDDHGRPLSQSAPHHNGTRCEKRYFFLTGNTTYGVQNLEYDPHTRTYLAAVYPGVKPAYINHPLFFLDASNAPVMRALAGRPGEVGLCLSPGQPHRLVDARGGCGFPLGSTGVSALGGGLYAFSHPLTRPDGCGRQTYASEIVRYHLDPDADDIFVAMTDPS